MSETDSTETWRAVPGYPYYEVSDLGRVRSLPRTYVRCRPGYRETVIKVAGKILKPSAHSPNGGRYLRTRVNLERGQKPIHRLVLLAFVGPCPEKMECRHLNGNAKDNRLINLEWARHRTNVRDSIRHGTKSPPPKHKGESHPQARLTDNEVARIRATKPIVHGTKARLAREYKVSQPTIARTLAGKTRVIR